LQRLEVRLAFNVGAGLLVFSIVAGLLTYFLAFRNELEKADALQRQLVLTVQAQAEVAAFAANGEIAQGVLEGLTANSIIIAARIESSGAFMREFGSRKDVNFGAGKAYPLFSPVDHIERIGTLLIVRDDEQIERAATQAAVHQTAFMLGQVLIATIIFALVLRMLVVNPLGRLVQDMASIQPGSLRRLQIEPAHENDEIGLLSKNANAFLDAADAAIAEVNAHRNELQKLANQDSLTGLPTMRLADDRLRMACTLARRTGQKVALLFIDLDGFKAVNDAAGHDTGDLVLKEVARRLLENIRADDTAARIGGDEFVVILGGLAEEHGAGRVAENIVVALARPIEVAGYVARLGASIGIALYPDHTGDVATMRGIADRAMYKVKKSGKGDFAFGDADPYGGSQ
jgi:diguanylate cyclase (GGDEF)-like protein